jgi:membrane protein implicated in regulation of membrane protease activity
LRSRLTATPLRGLLLGSAAVALVALALPPIGVEPASAAAATSTAATPSAWTADAARSTLEFTFEQAGAKTTGRFARFMANIDFSTTDPASGRFDVNIDIGERVQVPQWNADGTARVSYRGSLWSVRFRGEGPPEPGEHIIRELDGSELLLERRPAAPH